MRNYIGELKGLGYTLKALSKETGISQAELSRFKTGVKKLSSGSKDYETIRNTTRRLGYQEARAAGLTSERALATRRTITDPEKLISDMASKRIVKHKAETTRFQMRILGKFHNYKTGDTAIKQGFSHAYTTINKKEMEAEAVAEAQSKLGGSNWKLQKILEREIIEYELKDISDDETDDESDDEGE